MSTYIVIENDSGLRVAELEAKETAEEAARKHSGVIVDPGPYHSYEDAYDALMLVPEDERERAKLRE